MHLPWTRNIINLHPFVIYHIDFCFWMFSPAIFQHGNIDSFLMANLFRVRAHSLWNIDATESVWPMLRAAVDNGNAVYSPSFGNIFPAAFVTVAPSQQRTQVKLNQTLFSAWLIVIKWERIWHYQIWHCVRQPNVKCVLAIEFELRYADFTLTFHVITKCCNEVGSNFTLSLELCALSIWIKSTNPLNRIYFNRLRVGCIHFALISLEFEINTLLPRIDFDWCWNHCKMWCVRFEFQINTLILLIFEIIVFNCWKKSLIELQHFRNLCV